VFVFPSSKLLLNRALIILVLTWYDNPGARGAAVPGASSTHQAHARFALHEHDDALA
jgi:hypothetical protein